MSHATIAGAQAPECDDVDNRAPKRFANPFRLGRRPAPSVQNWRTSGMRRLRTVAPRLR